MGGSGGIYKDMAKVSIIMVTYRRAQFIVGAVQSALDQTYEDWELIVVDDSEDDATAKVMGQFKGDKRIHYFHREKKGTIASGSNFALGKATGMYGAILDDDDWWRDPEKLKKQAAFLDTHSGYVGCGGGFVIVNEKNEQVGKVLKQETDEEIRRVALYANPMANSTTMFRISAAKAIGGYDESLPQYADWDFWLKLGEQGRLYNAPEYFLAYRMWDKSASFNNQKQIADTGYRIVMRHRNNYPRFWLALLVITSYRIYARFPMGIRRNMNGFMSRLKKFLFSG